MTKLSKPFTWLWVAWVAMFAAIEFYAIRRRRSGDTLTEHIRAVRGWHPAAAAALGVLASWLVFHLATNNDWPF